MRIWQNSSVEVDRLFIYIFSTLSTFITSITYDFCHYSRFYLVWLFYLNVTLCVLIPGTGYLLYNAISIIVCSKLFAFCVDSALRVWFYHISLHCVCLFAEQPCELYLWRVFAEENIARVEEARDALIAYSELRTDNSKRAKKTTKTNSAEKQYLQEID